MIVCLSSSHIELYKDFYDIIKIFIPNLEFDLEAKDKEYDLLIDFIEKIEQTEHYAKFSTVYNNTAYEAEDNCSIEIDHSLEYKKNYKRFLKNTLYFLLKKIFGKTSPWGSLTGVRPSYLLYESLEKLGSLDRATVHIQKFYDLDLSKVNLLRDVVKTQLTIKPILSNDIDVYIGIPFCTSRCSYCTFASNNINDESINAYLKSLFFELKEIRRIIKNTNLNIRALYIGGGTPTALGDRVFNGLLDQVDLNFSDFGNFEYSVEAGRPDTINKFKLKSMKEHNVNRISINPQTLNDNTLKLIGRNHSANDFIESFDLARTMGFDNINTDIIAALPKENINDFIYTMDNILKLNPESITVHTLALKKNSILSNEGYYSKDNSVYNNMVDTAREMVYANGYSPYYLYRQKNIASNLENVAYAKRNYECLYNVDIMEEKLSIIAAGAGAISKRVFNDRTSKIKRAANVSDLKTYIEKTNEMIKRKEELFYN